MRLSLSAGLDAPRNAFSNVAKTVARSLLSDNTPGFDLWIEDAFQANMAALGPELVTNGGFTSGTSGWSAVGGATLATVGGELEISASAGVFPTARQNITCTPGRLYVVFARTRRGTAADAAGVVIQTTGGTNVTTPSLNSSTASQVVPVFFTATDTTHRVVLYINGSSATGTAYFDNVSVREIDLSRCQLFQDSAGTLPVTAMGQPIGLILDPSKGLVRGPELFDGNHQTGWTFGAGITVAADKITFASAATTESVIKPLGAINKWYDITFRIQNYVSGNVRVIVSSGQVSAGYNANGTYTIRMQVTGAAGNIGFQRRPRF